MSSRWPTASLIIMTRRATKVRARAIVWKPSSSATRRRFNKDRILPLKSKPGRAVSINGRPRMTSSTTRQHYIDFLISGIMGANLMGGGLWASFVLVDMRVTKLLKRACNAHA